jgi:hypothetical protein
MANWVRNWLVVEGEKEHLDKFIEKAKGYWVVPLVGEKPDAEYASCLDFNQFIPIPVDFLTDTDTRYNWCEDNWDTGFSPHDADLFEKSDTSAKYFFSTRNIPPLPAIEAMGQQFPMLHFELSYVEPLAGFRGEWVCENGVMTGKHERMPDDWRDTPGEPVGESLPSTPVVPEPEITDADMPFRG